MLKIMCMFLGCNLPIQLLLKLLSSEYDDRLVCYSQTLPHRALLLSESNNKALCGKNLTMID